MFLSFSFRLEGMNKYSTKTSQTIASKIAITLNHSLSDMDMSTTCFFKNIFYNELCLLVVSLLSNFTTVNVIMSSWVVSPDIFYDISVSLCRGTRDSVGGEQSYSPEVF